MVARDALAVLGPHGRAHLQEAFPVGAPEHLLHELLRGLRGVVRERGADQFALEDEAVAHVRRERGHVAPRTGAGVGVAPFGVVAAHAGREFGEARKRGRARRRRNVIGHASAM